MAKAFFVDLTRCTGCRGCQIACKQWKNLPAEPTTNRGGHTNPPDLSSVTYKTVHMRELGKGKDFRMLFFPEQCRHCELAPCMSASTVDGAIVQDEKTGAVIFTPLTAQIDGQAVREACPYDIPRVDPQTKEIHKCDFCNDRVHEGMLPACVQACPTGCMSFGEREDMEKLADERLAKVKEHFPNAVLGDSGIVHVIYLYAEDPTLYHKFAVFAQNDAAPMTRRSLFAKLRRPVA